MNSTALSFLESKLQHAVKRFPLTLFFGLLTTGVVLFNVWTHTREAIDDPAWLFFLSTMLGLPLSFGVESLTRYRGFLRIAVFAAVAGCFWFLWKEKGSNVFLGYAWLVAGAHLFCAFSPLLTTEKDDYQFWKWNVDLFGRFIVATIYSGVLLVGLMIGLGIFGYLFSVKIDGRIYPTLMATILILFQSTFFTASAPLDQAVNNSLQRPLQRFVQWILLPLLLLYYALMITYSAKILLNFSLPRGNVAILVFGYSVLGVLTWLLLWPVQVDVDDAPPLAKLFRRYFLIALIPLMILLGFSLGERLKTYGMTERRYILSMGYLWLLFVIANYGFNQKRRLYLIPATLCALCILASFGPQGMSGLSERWQFARLERLWKQHQTDKNLDITDDLIDTFKYLQNEHKGPQFDAWAGTHTMPASVKDTPPSDLDRQNRPARTLEISALPVRINDHLSFVTFEVQDDTTYTYQDGVLAWKIPGKVITLRLNDDDKTIDFTLDDSRWEQLAKEGKSKVSPEDSVLRSNQQKFTIVVQKVSWRRDEDGKNRGFVFQGLLFIQD